VNLISAELRRLFARRFTRIMMIVILLALALVTVGVAASSHRHDAAALAKAQAQVAQIQQQQQADQRACEAEQAGSATDTSGKQFPPGFDCAQLGSWQPDPEDFLPHEFSFRDEASQLVIVLGGMLALLGFAIGASFVGAEWSSGGMMNLLLWRPRRVPTLLGKLFALLLGTAGLGVVYSGLFTAALWEVANLRGNTDKVTSGVWQSLALGDARALALGLFMACVGFAVASLGRHTATAMGVAVGYLVVYELGLRIVLEIARVSRPERFFLSNYVLAWLTKAQWYYDQHFCDHRSDVCQPPQWAIHLNQGLVALSALVLLTVGAAVWAMRRRDIT
jgi:hypothetical protein